MDFDEAPRALQYPVIQGYRIGQEIGGGGFSKVYKAINDERGHVIACKVVNLFISPSLGVGTPNIKELQKEVQVHKALKNQYILEFIHSEVVGEEKQQQGWVPGLYIQMELAIGGDLFDKIAPDEGVPEDLAKFYFAQLAAGIEFIHSKGIAHRDLKPENLLLAANGNLKVSDFGLCAVFRHKGKTRLLSGRCGSLPYVAPELGGPSGQGYAAEPVDIWGMGVVLYTLLVGNTPWDEPSDTSPEFCAFRTGELLQYDPWTRISGTAKDFLLRMLCIDPRQRITMEAVKVHPWSMTQSQLTREQIPDALTQGMRSQGMMAVVNPTYSSGPGMAYVTARSEKMISESQAMSQLNRQEMGFMRLTGNITQAGDQITTTTRFWLNLSPRDALVHLLIPYLHSELTEENVRVKLDNDGEDGGAVRVNKAAGAKSVQGVFVVRKSEALAENGHTLVIMRREKGSILHWRAFWWSIVRHQQIEPYVVRGDNGVEGQ
ncbi:hypothetical protein IAT38_001076 [Cryptococcus sp. DSM 104549]